ncbi:MAG: hypothetical protein JSV10_02420 [Candidatus Zixiibacteriota bacterium]|nr:MAG: hypothetical protein JSV10_02420 [candidate division Zixibacteria bacterium]
MLTELSKKSINVKKVAKRALEDKSVLSELLEGVLSKKETIRFNSFKVLMFISEEHPKVLYARWDFFADLLSSPNTYFKYIAIYIITNLTKVDTKSRFETIFNRFYALLDDKSMIPASHVAGNSAKIVKAKPKLQTKITNKLLAIDKTHHHPERRDLIKGYAIEAFSDYFEGAKNKRKILNFVQAQTESKSPRTRKKAKEFLKKWEE